LREQAELISALRAVLEGNATRDHLCSVYDTPEEHYGVSIPFIRLGLERDEKCFYFADDGRAAEVHRALEAQGVDADRAIGTRSLVLATKAQAHLRDGGFDPERMYGFWRDATARAHGEGFSGLRVTGETEWVLRGAPGLDRWVEYESALNQRLRGMNCFALCQYHLRLFPPQVILGVLRAHPVVIFGDTVYRDSLRQRQGRQDA
jgi:hypothetical protein